MKAVIVCLLSLFVISCLAEYNESWRSEIVVSAKEVKRPLKGVLSFLSPFLFHVGIVVTTNAGRSHLIHNTLNETEWGRNVLTFVFGGGKPGIVLWTDWKMPQNWKSTEITPVRKGVTVQEVFNAMWGGNYKRAIGNGTYGFSDPAGICYSAVENGKRAITGRCDVISGDCTRDYLEYTPGFNPLIISFLQSANQLS